MSPSLDAAELRAEPLLGLFRVVPLDEPARLAVDPLSEATLEETSPVWASPLLGLFEPPKMTRFGFVEKGNKDTPTASEETTLDDPPAGVAT